MHLKPNKKLLLLSCCLVSGGLLYLNAYLPNRRLETVLQVYDGNSFAGASQSIQTLTKIDVERSLQIEKLWRNRADPKAEVQLASLVKPSSPVMVSESERIVRWLMKTENPSVVPVLQEFLKEQTPQEKSRSLALLTKLAVAKIQSRGLTGKARMEAMAQSIGLRWGDVTILSKSLNIKGKPIRRLLSPASGLILDVFVDTLYSMQKKGQDTSPLNNQLERSKYMDLRLKAGSVTTGQELDLILDYLDRSRAVERGPKVQSDLIEIGAPARDRILLRLQEMTENKTAYRVGRGYAVLFRAIASMEEQKAVPLLRKLAQDENKWVSHYASSAGKRLANAGKRLANAGKRLANAGKREEILQRSLKYIASSPQATATPTLVIVPPVMWAPVNQR